VSHNTMILRRNMWLEFAHLQALGFNPQLSPHKPVY